MPFMRRRPLLRAAAVGGGAYALGRAGSRRREEEAYEQGMTAGAPPAPAAPAASAGITSEDTARLAELGRLHDSGVLTDEEFAAEKAKILGT